MRASHAIALALAIAIASPAWGKGAKRKFDKKAKKQKPPPPDDADKETPDDEAAPDERGSDRAEPTRVKDDDKPATAKPSAASNESDESDGRDESDARDKGETRDKRDAQSKSTGKAPDDFLKQDLTGHDLGTAKKDNEFERDRFFVDKIDTPATEGGTLIQGSLTSSSLAYIEKGGDYPPAVATNQSPGSNSAAYSRYFTDLRLQTDFRHIGGSRWEARIDARARVVNSPTAPTEPLPAAPNGHVQSGLTGQNEYEVRELWLIRNGERTDFVLGRQFIADLAAVKIDGLRFDYASSKQLTFLGFAGLYPLRGSRSITTDYIALKNPADPTQSAGKFVGAGGFGAAYRTPLAYGAFGGVALVPFEKEQPRVFATANGYYRPNPLLDIYHYALIDVVSSYGAQITNLTAGLNYKPHQRLRMTASVNHVDTDSLNIQAAAFYDSPQSNPVVQNEIALQRLSTSSARASISAGLGHLQRFELTAAMGFRYRPSFALNTYTAAGGTPLTYQLDAAKSVDVYGSILDRNSIFDARIGIDAMQSYGVGAVAFQRNEMFSVRGFVGHALGGRGEWEAEVSYTKTKDSGLTATCGAGTVPTCFGQSNGTVLSGGGALYYRASRDWFFIGQAYVSRTNLTSGMLAADPAITGLTGYLRIAYRF